MSRSGLSDEVNKGAGLMFARCVKRQSSTQSRLPRLTAIRKGLAPIRITTRDKWPQRRNSLNKRRA